MNSVPRMLRCDAYTLSSSSRFESEEAQQYSEYYLTFRKFFNVTDQYDERIVFAGLQHILHQLLDEPVTHEEIDLTVKFLKNRKVVAAGTTTNFDFDEQMWRTIVNDFDGRIPLFIEAMPEGSVVYPNEPVIRIRSTVEGMGPLAAWFESKILHCWAATARLTAARQWLSYNEEMIRSIEKENYQDWMPQIMMHDFGDRSAICAEESEVLGMTHLYCFTGTDTFAGAFRAWQNGAAIGIGTSVDALAHRIVQGFVDENDCYEAIYNQAANGELISMVSDCYDFFYAVENYLLPLALRSRDENNGKVVVIRPDSGDAWEQVNWTLDLLEQNGLVELRSNGYKYCTTARMILGDSMNFVSMKRINDLLIEKGYAPHGVLIYGVGGALRNNISRDLLSAKYALCAVGDNRRGVCKASMVEGKSTLPTCIVSRDPDDLVSGHTLWHTDSGVKDSMVAYYNNGIWGSGMMDDFMDIRTRVIADYPLYPLQAGRLDPDLAEQRKEILESHVNTPRTSESF